MSGSTLHRSLGGKGANQAVAAARLGANVSLVGAVADDTLGIEAIRLLKATGVDASLVALKSDCSTGTAIILVDAHGQNQIVVVPGANALLSDADIAKCTGQIARSSGVVANLEAPLAAVSQVFGIARGHGVPTILNPAPWRECDSLLSVSDWIVLNETETQQLCGVFPNGEVTAAAAALMIRTRFSRASVALTLGASGVWIDSLGFVGLVSGFVVEALDTVGAGDTWVGAFAVELANGSNVSQAARFANAAAALSVTRLGAQAGMPSREEVDRFLGAELHSRPAIS